MGCNALRVVSFKVHGKPERRSGATLAARDATLELGQATATPPPKVNNQPKLHNQGLGFRV